jgi:DNA-binding response OmpR family regulator
MLCQYLIRAAAQNNLPGAVARLLAASRVRQPDEKFLAARVKNIYLNSCIRIVLGMGAVMIHFNDLVFDAEMLTARRDDGTELRFTRQERVLLLQFTGRPGKLMTRARLIDLLTRDGDGAGERNVDFVVNRLRKRLGDNARDPRFIATQYGEGYVWIAKSDERRPTPFC